MSPVVWIEICSPWCSNAKPPPFSFAPSAASSSISSSSSLLSSGTSWCVRPSLTLPFLLSLDLVAVVAGNGVGKAKPNVGTAGGTAALALGGFEPCCCDLRWGGWGAMMLPLRSSRFLLWPACCVALLGVVCCSCGGHTRGGPPVVAMWLAKAAIDCAPAGVAMKDIACAKALGSRADGGANGGFAYVFEDVLKVLGAFIWTCGADCCHCPETLSELVRGD